MNNSADYDPYEIQQPRPPLLARIWAWVISYPMRFDQWAATRQWPLLLQGLPAIVVAAVMVGIVTVQWSGGPTRHRPRYQVAVREAMLSEDYEAADVYLRKLARLDSNDNEIQYGLGVVEFEKDNVERARQIMQELAPEDGDGYPQAHLWLAMQMVEGGRQLSGDEAQVLEHHLKASLKGGADSAQAHGLLGQIHFQRREFKEAATNLERAVTVNPGLNLQLGLAYLQLEKKQMADRAFHHAAQYFQKMLETDPRNEDVVISLASAIYNADDFGGAQQVLTNGLQQQPNNIKLRNAIASLCLEQADRYADDESKVQQRMMLLERAMTVAPNHQPTLERLANVMDAGSDEANSAMRAKLVSALADGTAATSVHMILGTRAAQRGDNDAAAMHFEQARRLNPELPVLLNNFAWLLCMREQPDLPRALQMIEQALESEPNNPNFRETRGQIFVKLTRFADALEDLEFALPHFRGKPTLHQALSVAYRELGDAEMAAEHSRRAGLGNGE